MTSAGKWNSHYAGLIDREPYGDSPTYALAADWVADCHRVEDWGCGKGWLRGFIEPKRYWGVDGSLSPLADEVADLTTYTSTTSGLVLRHVLEHEYRWAKVLENAVASCTQRLFVALFTPMADSTHVLTTEADYDGAPVIGFNPDDLTSLLPAGWSIESIPSPSTFYGVETIIRWSA